jgi:uncharacterized protein YggE
MTMKSWLAPLAAAAFALMPVAGAHADSPPVPQLSANGEGEVKVVPDIAVVNIGVTSRGRDAGAALAANSTDLAKVIDAIKAAGVAEKDIGTSGFAISPVYRQPENGQPSDEPAAIIGYEVSNQVRVVIRSIATSGGILDAVVTAGANQIYGIGFDLEDRSAAEREAVTQAIADAKARAEVMAEAAGVRLVRILSINAGANGGAPMPMAMARDSFSAKAVPVMPGERSVTASASIVWEIAPK